MVPLNYKQTEIKTRITKNFKHPDCRGTNLKSGREDNDYAEIWRSQNKVETSDNVNIPSP